MSIKKILICDDAQTDLVNLKEVLAGLGAVIITATNGLEAVEKARKELPDLVFLDIVMEGYDGYQACRDIKADPLTKGIPVVFVSSKNQRVDQLWATRQGGTGLVSKPYSDEQILEQVNLHC